MRQQSHDGQLVVRVNEGLLAAAVADAQRKGMSLSELVRHAVRREVGRAR